MRPTRLNVRLPVAVVLGAALAATALVGNARAGDDSGRPIDEQILHNILTGIGLQDPNAVRPTYRERSPLVIPSSDALPKPGSARAAIANNPAWPKDPDVERAKKLAKQQAEESSQDAEEQFQREKRPLLPSEIGPKYADRGPARPSYDFSASDPEKKNQHLLPSQLGYVGGLFGNMFGSDSKEEAAKFTGEPARTSLTEPPPGYQTPSPTQPYGTGSNAWKPKAENSYLNHGTVKLPQ